MVAVVLVPMFLLMVIMQLSVITLMIMTMVLTQVQFTDSIKIMVVLITGVRLEN